jgi:hypothetical protein
MQEDAHLLTEIHANHMEQNCEWSKLKISAITTVICAHRVVIITLCGNKCTFIYFLFIWSELETLNLEDMSFNPLRGHELGTLIT